ncbi:MAG: succinate dehydrogenase, hydrophobic membrane anchor protein [Dokdonella sp.]|uniref:succinate dehydrogenase, hydrophobic membrane anchor protein n=1 Tax=Dokdonella sp. TaxID=2291710 RepID=UPI0032647825
MSVSYRTPLKRAIGLGSAKHGVHHFVAQRVTAVALALLGIWFVWIALQMLHLDYAGAHALIARPWNALLMVAFAIAVFWHAQLGLQVVIEDYVHATGVAWCAQLTLKFLCFLGAAASVLAVVRITLGH